MNQSKTILYTLEEIKRDAEIKIISLNQEKVYYNTFAYFDSVSTKRNLTWKRETEPEDRRIYLANAKLSDISGSMWVTVCSGGDTILGMKPSEAHELQSSYINEPDAKFSESQLSE